MNPTLQSQEKNLLDRKVFLGLTTAGVILVLIMVLSLGLHLTNIDRLGDANAYYTAAVESMLKSWQNFFFAAAEPGGSVTVDKPPLGLWIEAAFAYLLGVSGFSVTLPNILAGVMGLPLLYGMVKKYMGALAGIVAALVMAITPVFLATNRNNTMDGLLVFFLLMAAWAFIQATETGKARWLMLGAFIVGLGFNIKMLQAFLPLPACYGLYFLGSREGWMRKVFKLGVASMLLIAVSLSWAVIVDLTPADQRPYIGSSGDNTVMGLILGHNGTSRLFTPDGRVGAANPNDGSINPPTNPAFNQGFQPNQVDDQFFPGSGQQPIPGNGAPSIGLGQLSAGGQGGTPFSNETGTPGIWRFFTSPLSKQMSWLLPFALVGLLAALFSTRIRLPIEAGVHKALILWGGWLLTCLVFFSVISGIFHAYYAIMLAPALGGVVGVGFGQLWVKRNQGSLSSTLLVISALLTIGFQIFASIQYADVTGWLIPAAALLMAGLLFLLLRIARGGAFIAILVAMMLVPAYWTVMTVVSISNVNLPTAYGGLVETGPGDGGRQLNISLPTRGRPGEILDDKLVQYLEDNSQDVYYLAAVPSSMTGARLVLATGRPVLYMGGFGGQDEVVSVDELAKMVESGELRYVLLGGDRGNNQHIQNWVQASCSVIPEFNRQSAAIRNQADGQFNGPDDQPGRRDQGTILYLCE
jgi:4-amino-4-deoxy-L-arabinose transferase-like glycosyltransferase